MQQKLNQLKKKKKNQSGHLHCKCMGMEELDPIFKLKVS